MSSPWPWILLGMLFGVIADRWLIWVLRTRENDRIADSAWEVVKKQRAVADFVRRQKARRP